MRNGKLLSLEDEKTVCKMLNNLSIECSMFDCPTRLKANYFMCQCWVNILRGEWGGVGGLETLSKKLQMKKKNISGRCSVFLNMNRLLQTEILKSR